MLDSRNMGRGERKVARILATMPHGGTSLAFLAVAAGMDTSAAGRVLTALEKRQMVTALGLPGEPKTWRLHRHARSVMDRWIMGCVPDGALVVIVRDEAIPNVAFIAPTGDGQPLNFEGTLKDYLQLLAIGRSNGNRTTIRMCKGDGSGLPFVTLPWPEDVPFEPSPNVFAS